MARKHNFSAGPSTLPLSVLEKAQAELVDTGGLGLSILEMSHRSKEFAKIFHHARETLARLLALPEGYEILFLQGGASQQFAMVPMNLGSGAYLTTGIWSEKALEEARIVSEPHEIWSDEAGGYRKVPAPDETLEVPAGATYLHYTTNNTVAGTQYHHVPKAAVPLVADMSSDILSRPLDLQPFGLIYAGAQKNAGPAGITIVIGRSSLLRTFAGRPDVPKIFRYRTHAEAGSIYNTALTFNLYVCSLVFDWIEEQGGLGAIAKRNEEKARRLYEVIDRRPDVFLGHAEEGSRSLMNVTFRLPNQEAEERFLQEAKARDCIGLAGHRSVGGIRASIYNAQPMEAVEVLIEVMDGFRL